MLNPHVKDIPAGPAPQKARPVGSRNWPIGMAKPRAEAPPEVGSAERDLLNLFHDMGFVTCCCVCNFLYQHVHTCHVFHIFRYPPFLFFVCFFRVGFPFRA